MLTFFFLRPTIETSDSNLPKVIAFSDATRNGNAVQPRLGSAMDSFMSYLLFWQDTIDHCQSAEVNDTLLDHFQVLFLEQLLYPSLLESSDVEGGSTSAVLTYLCRILESLEQPDLVYRILHFLLASPSNVDSLPPSTKSNADPKVSLSRRKSIDALNALTTESTHPSPSLFNLRDLVLLGLQSSNEQTALATLRLLVVVLHYHPSFAGLLIRTMPDRPGKQRSVGAINAELRHLLPTGLLMVSDPTLDASYDNYLKDASWTIESRLCFLNDDFHPPLQLREDDPIMRELLGYLENFFTSSVAINLSLTEVLVSIASSPLISLDGWILVDPAKYIYDVESKKQITTTPVLHQIRLAYQQPRWDSTPVLAAVLQNLVSRVQRWRDEVPDFDLLIIARRNLLLDVPNADQELEMGTMRASSDEQPPSPSQTRDISSPPAQTQSPQTDLGTRLSKPFSTTENGEGQATLGHALTNIVLLYEFLLELTAVVQVRSILLEEAGYPDVKP